MAEDWKTGRLVDDKKGQDGEVKSGTEWKLFVPKILVDVCWLEKRWERGAV